MSNVAQPAATQQETREYMARRVEPLITELVQSLYVSRTISSAVDVPAAMLSFLRRRRMAPVNYCASPARRRRRSTSTSLPVLTEAMNSIVTRQEREPSPRSTLTEADRQVAMRELKPLLCELCREACAEQPDDVAAFFVCRLERRPVFLSPLYHIERVTPDDYVAVRRRSFGEDVDYNDVEDDSADYASHHVPTPRLNAAAHRAKVERLQLPAWWLPEDQWRLVWWDDFDYEGLPDPSRWGFQTSCNNWCNDDHHRELQHYTAGRPENAWVSGGVLRVTARREKLGGCDYTSARLHTKHKGDWLYGRMDVCARLPQERRRGLWPALWLLPTDSKYGRWPRSGEIDVMEHVGWDQQGAVHSSVHTMASNHRSASSSHVQSKAHSQTRTVLKEARHFHLYSLLWRPNCLQICVDGALIHTYDRASSSDSSSWEQWPFDQRFFLLINLAVGGKWGGLKGVDDDAFPASLEVAYVRVYQQHSDSNKNNQPKRPSSAPPPASTTNKAPPLQKVPAATAASCLPPQKVQPTRKTPSDERRLPPRP